MNKKNKGIKILYDIASFIFKRNKNIGTTSKETNKKNPEKKTCFK